MIGKLTDIVKKNWTMVPMGISMGTVVLGLGWAGYGIHEMIYNPAPNAGLVHIIGSTLPVFLGSVGTALSYKLHEYTHRKQTTYQNSLCQEYGSVVPE